MNTSGGLSPDSITSSPATTTFVVLGLLALLISTTSIVFDVKKRRRQSSKPMAKLPPSPRSWPVIGNLPEVMRKKPVAFRWIHQVMKEMDTDICLIRLAGTNIIPVLDPAIAREMLKKQDELFAGRPFSVGSHAVSGGYKTTALVPYDDHWRKMRKKSVNLRVVTQHYCGNLMRKIMFNKRFFGEPTADGGPGPKEVEHLEAVFETLKYVYTFSISNMLPFLRGLDLDGQGKLIKKANKTMRDYQNPIIDERIRQWQSGERKEMEDLTDVFITLKDADGKPLLSRDEITNQAAEIMIATVDNPSNAVEWVMAELINQPELLAKATTEIDRVVGKDRLVQESDIGGLNYVKACARESFRLHPLSPFNLPHVAAEDTVVAGYFIPKGSYALLSRYGLGRNPKVWPDPLKFDPERHLHDPEVVLTEHELRFISFSTMMFARLIQCFSWAPSNGAKSIDSREAENELVLMSPLVVSATPRLAPHLYPNSV
ncbi:Valine N-monooxygenase 1 [Linum grandiflorum]